MPSEHAIVSEVGEIGEIRDEIIAAIRADELVLPSMPEVSPRVREAAEDDDVSVASICDVIASDAAMAARIIKVANSPLFRAVKEVDNLKVAISRMGIPYTSNLAIGVAMEQLYQSTSEDVDRHLREPWTHSTEVASLSYTYCRHFSRLKPDQAALAGLVHEIGKLPLLVWADENEVEGDLLSSLLEEAHSEVGVEILTHWDFPAELRHVPMGTVDFERQVPDADYVDLVTVASLHSVAGTSHHLANQDWHAVSAFDRLGVAIDEVMMDESEFAGDLAEARQMLA